MLVVKLGGSLAASRNLARWIEVLAEHGGGRTVVVPGGGPFADTVRAAQKQWCFGDDTAHRMAIYAMVQYGLMLSGLSPVLKPAADINAIHTVLRGRKVPVWLPAPMALDDPDIEASWRITSDSLALWLAAELKLDRVALVKSAPLGATGVYEADLRAAGLVDALFYDYARYSCCEIGYLGPEDHSELARSLCDNSLPGVQISY